MHETTLRGTATAAVLFSNRQGTSPIKEISFGSKRHTHLTHKLKCRKYIFRENSRPKEQEIRIPSVYLVGPCNFSPHFTNVLLLDATLSFTNTAPSHLKYCSPTNENRVKNLLRQIWVSMSPLCCCGEEKALALGGMEAQDNLGLAPLKGLFMCRCALRCTERGKALAYPPSVDFNGAPSPYVGAEALC